MEKKIIKISSVFIIGIAMLLGGVITTNAEVTTGLDPESGAVTCPAGYGLEDFESGTDGYKWGGPPIASTVPGVEFITTQGQDWWTGDWAAGYNGKYPSGAYTSGAQKWAWLGVSQGSGIIDFTEGEASYVSIYTSTYSGVVLDAYADDGTFLASSGWASNNINTGKMTQLSISRPTADIGYVIVHDTGNYWLIDWLCTDAPGVQPPTPTNQPPVADVNGPYLGDEGSPITFDGSGSSDPDGTIVSYEWDLDGDGQYDDATGVNPTFTWSDDYTGTIGLKVTDDGSLTDTDSTTVTVNNVPPTANAGSDQTVIAGDTVNFTGSMTDPGWLDTHTYQWDFDASDGVGVDATGQTANHVYYNAGVYTATLTVIDDDGGIGIDTLEVTVKPIPATIDCDPDTLNLKSKGDWVTCYIELVEGYDVKDIDAATILLNGLIPPELDPKYGFVKSEESYIMDHDGDGILERMVKFDRSAVQALFPEPVDPATLTLTGKVAGADFEGTDTIRVIDKGEGNPENSGGKPEGNSKGKK